MNARTLPGFTAEASLPARSRHYRSIADGGTDQGDGGVIPQMAASAARARGPFSGSCGCNGWGVCCCILCWYDQCAWWCWAPTRTGRF